MKLELLNESAKYPPPHLRPAPPHGYLHLAAAVAPPTGPPVVRSDAGRTRVLEEVKALAATLARDVRVEHATVFRAVVVPPPTGYARHPRFHRARFDVAVLVQTAFVDQLGEVEESEACQALMSAVADAAEDTHVMRARCVKSLGDVDEKRPGLFLFNHFVAEDPELAVELWDHLAGWYVKETHLDNSTLLQPLSDGDYAVVNHARWDTAAPVLFLQQVTRPSFYRFVQDNLLVNRVGVMPVLYRLA